jgi:hypothetical protein
MSSTWRAVTFDGLDDMAGTATERGGRAMSYVGFEDAMGDVDDVDGLDDYGILDNLGLGPETATIIPPALGAAVAFGTTAALRYFVKDRTSAWYSYAGGIGAVASLVPAYALWKYQGKGAAITAATAGVLTGLGLWLLPKVEASSGLGAYIAEEPVPLLQGYEIEQATPLLQGAPELLSGAPELLSGAPELLSGAPELLSDQPEIVSGMGTMAGWSPAFV